MRNDSELAASAVRRVATGKIDGSSEPSSSLVASRAFQAPAYVNTDCGAKASAFDRIQVNALVCMVTAAAGMVEIGSTRSCDFGRDKKEPYIKCGVVLLAHQYSSANMIVSTRVTTGSPFALLTSGSSYKSILKKLSGHRLRKSRSHALGVDHWRGRNRRRL